MQMGLEEWSKHLSNSLCVVKSFGFEENSETTTNCCYCQKFGRPKLKKPSTKVSSLLWNKKSYLELKHLQLKVKLGRPKFGIPST